MVRQKQKRVDLPKIGDSPEEEDNLQITEPTKASLNEKVERLIEKHPDRALKVVRRWMEEE